MITSTKTFIPFKAYGEYDYDYKIVEITFNQNISNDKIYKTYYQGNPIRDICYNYQDALLQLSNIRKENYYKTWELN